MSEREYEIKPVGVDYICDECNTGVMQHTGGTLLSSPPKYPHACSHCRSVQNLRHSYPIIKWVRVPS